MWKQKKSFVTSTEGDLENQVSVREDFPIDSQLKLYPHNWKWYVKKSAKIAITLIGVTVTLGGIFYSALKILGGARKSNALSRPTAITNGVSSTPEKSFAPIVTDDKKNYLDSVKNELNSFRINELSQQKTKFTAVLSNSTNKSKIYDTYAPEILANQLSINKGQTVVLNSSNINIVDDEQSAGQLEISVSNIVHGHFICNGTDVTKFIMQDIIDGKVSFIHDNSTAFPHYSISASDGINETPLEAAIITFNGVSAVPNLLTNTLTVGRGDSVVLSTNNLNASDAEQGANELIFVVCNVLNGFFERIAEAGTQITVFTLQEIQNNAIRFVHDASANPPSYDVSVSDGMYALYPITAETELVSSLTAINANAQLTYLEGKEFSFAANDAKIMVNTPASTIDVKLTLSDPAAGRIPIGKSGAVMSSYTATTGVWEASGIRDDVNNLLAVLKFQPTKNYLTPFSIIVDATDTYNQTWNSIIDVIGKTHTPKIEIATFDFGDQKQITIDSSMLYASDIADDITKIEFIIGDNLQGCYFVDLDNPEVLINRFLQERVMCKKIAIIRDDSDDQIRFTIAATDGSSTSTPLSAIVKFAELSNSNNDANENAKDIFINVAGSLGGAAATGAFGYALRFFYKKWRKNTKKEDEHKQGNADDNANGDDNGNDNGKEAKKSEDTGMVAAVSRKSLNGSMRVKIGSAMKEVSVINNPLAESISELAENMDGETKRTAVKEVVNVNDNSIEKEHIRHVSVREMAAKFSNNRM